MGRDAKAEYLAGHIPGAVHFDIDEVKDPASPLPHMLPTPELFARHMARLGIGDGMRIVVYDGAGLFSAPRVWWTLRSFGANDVVVLDGGFPKWTAEGRPVEEGQVTRRPASFTPRFDNGAVAGLADIRRTLESGSAQIVDARPAERFRGEAPEPRPGIPSGHMPGSYSLPFAQIVADGRMKDADGLRAAFAAAGVDMTRPIVTTCGSGVSAAILALALEEIGRPAKALYDGSWAEWASTEGCPIENGPGGPKA
jgi:thiosulfate/3-mercaptopyruvate sulfurtransferase